MLAEKPGCSKCLASIEAGNSLVADCSANLRPGSTLKMHFDSKPDRFPAVLVVRVHLSERKIVLIVCPIEKIQKINNQMSYPV